MWKINAGRRSVFADQFIEHSVVAIGWSEGGDYTKCATRSAVEAKVRDAYPDMSQRQVEVASNQIWRFLDQIAIGDIVITYDPNARVYPIGEVMGDAEYLPDLIEQLPIARSVKWHSAKKRDSLSPAARGSLGAILTLFRVSDIAETELLRISEDNVTPPEEIEEKTLETEIEADPFEAMADIALERAKDRLRNLGWEDMQEVVAALLRSLGYRTIISPAGSDRGKDIVASKDGFGFERPRIVVEVKHRREAMGAPEIRSFVGGRHPDDRGLYVSTGGFTREAQYEAERASTVTHLMTLDGLARALIENYEQLDERGKSLLPMTRIYWPA